MHQPTERRMLSLLAAFVIIVAASTVNCESDGVGHWQILTKQNFSSQIRLHTHILLLVAVPWSGESRALMGDLTNSVVRKEEEFGSLKLMYMHRNSEKMLADAIGASATEGVTVLYYHRSLSYKYKGKLHARNILSSIRPYMPILNEEMPLKSLSSEEELNKFVDSTDKAVILHEHCGWMPKLLAEERKNVSENGFGLQGFAGHRERNRSSAAGGRKENLKGSGDDSMTCNIESGFGIPWIGGFSLVNESVSFDETDSVKNAQSGGRLSCTHEEFWRFKSFFSRFMTVTREFFLPPERHRFGLVSDQSLLSSLGLGDSGSWSVAVYFNRCPDCSVILKEGNDLERVIQMESRIVRELDADVQDIHPAVPSNRPSLLLFVDRSSDLSETKRKSKEALDALRDLALHHMPLDHMDKRNKDKPESSSVQALQEYGHISIHPGLKLSPTAQKIKLREKMSIMIVNEGKQTILDNIASDLQGSSLHEILTYVLQKQGERKLSAVAKEMGFQLLSDDLSIKVAGNVDKLPAEAEVDFKEETVGPSKKNPGRTTVSDLHEDPSLVLDEKSQHGVMKTSLENDEGSNFCERTQPGGVSASFEENEQKATYVDFSINVAGNMDKLPAEAEVDSKEEAVGPSKKNTGRTTVLDLHEDPSLILDEKSQLGEMKTSLQDDEESNFDERSQPGGVVASLEENEVKTTYVDSVRPDQLTSDYEMHTLEVGKAEEKPSSHLDKLEDIQVPSQILEISFFFCDGNNWLLRALTGGTKIPSLVAIDPILQWHHVFPKHEVLNYISMRDFLHRFLNGSLDTYQHSESEPGSSREGIQPPFVNMDFHEADSIQKVTARTFSEHVIGFNQSDKSNAANAWNEDVLVLFSNSWCGFCQRMELVVREVYRAIKAYMNILTAGSGNAETVFSGNNPRSSISKLPKIYLMDCTLNDCSWILRSFHKREVYPALLLFPAETKAAISYEGAVSVADVIKFMADSGSNSQHVTGILRSTSTNKGKNQNSFMDKSPITLDEDAVVAKDKSLEVLLKHLTQKRDVENDQNKPRVSKTSHGTAPQVAVGSILVATEKLSVPFDKSMIIIVKADPDTGFQGLIYNKPLAWDSLHKLEGLELVKETPLSFGGPLIKQGLPLVSLTRRDVTGQHPEVAPGIYFLDQLSTYHAIEELRSGNQSLIDYWFFLGFSSWSWEQLFDEIAQGAWNLYENGIGYLDWPAGS